MVDAKWQKVREVFDAALRQDPAERQDYLKKACGDDQDLLAEVESLFSSFDESDDFLETPAVAHVADVIELDTKRLQAGARFAHYEIIRQIGAGGMGEVYLAKDQNLNRRIAIKILSKKFSGDESNLSRFVSEAKAASALNHPNILVIHETGKSKGEYYIVSEFVEGTTLREVLTQSQLSVAEVLDISIQIASALAATHEAHLVHRDIKPENVMVRPDGYLKVLDFGLAKLIEKKNQSFLGLEESLVKQNQTAQGVILGTVNYMSPEQAKGENVDERTDIFSLGALLYEMIAGRTPFQDNSMSETFANLLHTEPQPLARYAANVPAGLQRIVAKTLEKNRDERYQTMKDVLSDLKDLKDNLAFDEKLERLQPSGNGNATAMLRAATGDFNKSTAETRYSVSQAIERHRSLAAIALTVLLFSAIGLGYYFLYPRKTASSVGDQKSIAILPLKPINAANRDEIYEFGIADSLIHRLGSMKAFFVRPLSARRKYADIEQDPIAAGKEQQVDYVLASNYQLEDGKIRVTAQLFNVASGQIEETRIIEKDASDIFAAQDAIAGEVGNVLRARFAIASTSPAAKLGTTNEEAYRLYLQGKNLMNQSSAEDVRKAVGYFEQAIRLDPSFARAYAAMARAFHVSGGLGPDPTSAENEKARNALNKALELDGNLADAYVARADLSLKTARGLDEVEKDLLRALELDPNNDLGHWVYALTLAYRGRLDEAMAEIETTLAIAPGGLTYQRDRGRILYYSRRYDEAIQQLERFLELDEKSASGRGWLWLAYEMKGDNAGAYRAFTEWQKRSNPERVNTYQKAYETGGWPGVKRKLVEFEKLNELKPGTNHFAMARNCALIRDKDQAFQYLNKVVEKREWRMVMMIPEPALDSLRDDPRFDELVKRAGLKWGEKELEQ